MSWRSHPGYICDFDLLDWLDLWPSYWAYPIRHNAYLSDTHWNHITYLINNKRKKCICSLWWLTGHSLLYVSGHTCSIGGQGGPMTSSIDAQLQQLFVSRGSSLSAEDFVVLVELSSKFYKTYIPYKNFYSSSKYPVYPLNCTNDPWTGSEIGNLSCISKDNLQLVRYDRHDID